MDRECVCGHVEDEHDEAGECTVREEGEDGPLCDCFYFEPFDPLEDEE